MAISLRRQINFETETEKIIVSKSEESPMTYLEISRLCSTGEAEDFQLTLDINELEALVKALKEMLYK